MALPDILLVRLIEAVQDHGLSGELAMLGRQRFVGSRRGRSAELLRETLAERLPGLAESDLRNRDDEYSETFFAKLGFSRVDSIDVSDFEGASIILDLGKPLDETKIQQFDVIYDGGTTEHVFDLPTAWRNMDRMLRPGGVLIGHSPCNNWINHGFFQICPEAVFGFWHASMGYEILDLFLQPLLPRLADRTVRTTNPLETGLRPRILGRLPAGAPLLMIYAIRKPANDRSTSRDVHQSDYRHRWDAGGARSSGGDASGAVAVTGGGC